MNDETIEARARAAASAPYTRITHRDADGWSVRVQELPGVYAGGDTVEEAMAYLDETIAEWVEAELRAGHDIPPPAAVEPPDEPSADASAA